MGQETGTPSSRKRVRMDGHRGLGEPTLFPLPVQVCQRARGQEAQLTVNGSHVFHGNYG